MKLRRRQFPRKTKTQSLALDSGLRNSRRNSFQRSLKTAPGFIAQFLQRQHTFLGRIVAELPTGKQLHPRCLARIGKLVRRALDGALLIRNEAKKSAEHFLLVGAVRTPVKTVHSRLFRGDALREGVVAVILAVPTGVIGAREQNDDDDSPNEHRGRLRLLCAVALLLPFSPLFRHKTRYFLYHGFHATTFNALGRTSSSWQCSVITSPSIITSTGPSRSKHTRRTAFRSAIGCSMWLPS